MRSLSRSCWLAALLLTSACTVNPRPEDPGANGLSGDDKSGGHGTGGVPSTQPPPFGSGNARDGGATTGVPTGPERVPVVRDAGTVGDAGVDAGVDSGPAKPDAPLP